MGQLDIVSSHGREAKIESFMDRAAIIFEICQRLLAAMMDLKPNEITPATTFADLGLDSAAAVHFVLAVEQETGLELEPGVTEEYPSLETFAKFIVGLQSKNVTQ